MKQRSVGRAFSLPELWPYLLFAGAVLSLHLYLAWTLHSSELTESDEPAHFTTSVMLFEYLRTALGANPLHFAESFYFRFPKVMMGHWPPGFYMVQAAAFFLTGPSQVAARAVSGAIAFTTSGVLMWRVRRWNGGAGVQPAGWSGGAGIQPAGLLPRAAGGWASAILAGAVFLSIRTIQLIAWQVMSDLLTGLFMMLAILAFSDFLDSLDGKSALRFLVWSVLAILTKGSAWALGLFAVLAPLLTGRWACLRSKWYWIPGVVIFLSAAPFYWLTRSVGIGYSQDVVSILGHAHPTLYALEFAVSFFTPLLLGVSILGFAWALYRRWVCKVETPEVRDALCAAAGILAQFLFLLLLPLTLEDRYFIPSGPLAVILFVQGAALAARWMARFTPRFAVLAPALLAIGVLAESRFPKPAIVTGFRPSVRSIPFRPQGSVILVSSDALGEGDWTADRLELDPSRAGVVLRASSVLASTRLGTHYKLRLPDSGAVIDYLHSTAVRYVVIDHSGEQFPHQVLLEEAVRKLSGEFQLMGSFPVSRGPQSGTVDVFVNNAVDRNPAEIRLPAFPSWGAYRMLP